MKINKSNTLYVRWSKKENDIMYHYPSPPDGHLIHSYFDPHRGLSGEKKSLAKELEARGYDITTLRFSIKKL